MRRMLSVCLILCLLLGTLAACGTPDGPNTPDEPNTPGNPNTPEDPDPQEPPVEVTYVQTYPYTDEAGNLHIRYQDTYTFENNIISVTDEEVTSTVCGSEEKDEKVLTYGENEIRAVGCGSVTVNFLEKSLRVIVDPSPINLLFVTGQSNASGDKSFAADTDKGKETAHTYAEYFIRTAPTMAYFTWTGTGLSMSGNYVASRFVPTSLNWDVIEKQSFPGSNPTVLAQKTTDFSHAGWCAALAHEWVEQTGERVWIVNASHGGHAIDNFLPSEDGTPIDNDYYQAVSVFVEAIKTLTREVEAGHFTLNHMAYYWFQGESDSTRSDAYYLEQFAKVHTALQQDVVYRNGNEEKKLEYCGIMTLRSCADNTGNSNAELAMIGPRLAQYYMGGATKGVFSNVYIVSKVTELWVGGDENVENYFLNTYGSPEAFYEIFGYDMPTTMYEVHPTIHYLMKGHNEMGMDAARNSLRIINATQPDKNYRLSYGEEEDVTVTLLSQDGFTPLGSTLMMDAENGACVYPAVTPTYAICRGVELVSETEGVVFEGYCLKPSGSSIPATVTFSLYLGGEKYGTYTYDATFSSRFSQNFPAYEKVDGNYTFLSHGNGWRCGYLTYATGLFHPFFQIASSGWLYNGASLWGAGNQGAFWLSSAMRVGLSTDTASCAAIEYIPQHDGEIGVSVDLFSPNLNDVYLAIVINGEMVWPRAGGSLTEKADWYHARKGQDDTDTLAAAWEALTLRVKAGDSVTFLLARADGTGQTLLHPVIYYKTEE